MRIRYLYNIRTLYLAITGPYKPRTLKYKILQPTSD